MFTHKGTPGLTEAGSLVRVLSVDASHQRSRSPFGFKPSLSSTLIKKSNQALKPQASVHSLGRPAPWDLYPDEHGQNLSPNFAIGFRFFPMKQAMSLALSARGEIRNIRRANLYSESWPCVPWGRGWGALPPFRGGLLFFRMPISLSPTEQIVLPSSSNHPT